MSSPVGMAATSWALLHAKITDRGHRPEQCTAYCAMHIESCVMYRRCTSPNSCLVHVHQPRTNFHYEDTAARVLSQHAAPTDTSYCTPHQYPRPSGDSCKTNQHRSALRL